MASVRKRPSDEARGPLGKYTCYYTGADGKQRSRAGFTDKAKSKPLATLEEIERIHILRTVEALEGRKPDAAKALGISLKTLYNKLNAYKAQAEHTDASKGVGG